MDSPCVSVSSVGSLRFFRKENAPAGAAATCMGGCKAKKDCPYDAEKLYLTDPFYKAKFIKYMKRTLTGKAHNKRSDVENAVRNGDRKVWFADGETLFGRHDRRACTVDGIHPSDLGFYRMAHTLLPFVKEALNS